MCTMNQIYVFDWINHVSRKKYLRFYEAEQKQNMIAHDLFSLHSVAFRGS